MSGSIFAMLRASSSFTTFAMLLSTKRFAWERPQDFNATTRAELLHYTVFVADACALRLFRGCLIFTGKYLRFNMVASSHRLSTERSACERSLDFSANQQCNSRCFCCGRIVITITVKVDTSAQVETTEFQSHALASTGDKWMMSDKLVWLVGAHTQSKTLDSSLLMRRTVATRSLVR
eukprot:COSAG02_NODE_13238_length_1421_cov_2.783661_1_plen_178_part_00